MLVSHYIQEAENLHAWCRQDKEALSAAGLDWIQVDDLPVRAGALREAESNLKGILVAGRYVMLCRREDCLFDIPGVLNKYFLTLFTLLF